MRLWGLTFASPLGVAAGLDKNAEAVDALLALGFGHVEAGTVTPRPQPGNAKPRMWRLDEQRAVINALGFPGDGAEAMLGRLDRRGGASVPGVVGLNIGKNRDTPLERASDDYSALVKCFAGKVDFLTINVSSPNTPGLRDLQLVDALARLLARAQEANREAAGARGTSPTPLLLKLAPDLEDGQLREIAAAAAEQGIDGVVATNTTIDRQGLSPAQQALEGGLSGAPLKRRANEVARVLYRELEGRVPIVGVGGIASAADVIERMRSGASLVQIYTGFIFGGPGLPGRILKELIAELDRHGWASISEIVGRDA